MARIVPKGRPWEPGKSGNPSGKPKMPKEIKESLRKAAPDAVDTLLELMRTSPDDKVRLAAAVKVLEYNFGKDPLPVHARPPKAETVTVEPAQEAEHESDQPKHLAAVLGVLARVGRLPAGSGEGGTGESVDAEVDEVRAAPAAPDAEGLPSPE